MGPACSRKGNDFGVCSGHPANDTEIGGLQNSKFRMTGVWEADGFAEQYGQKVVLKSPGGTAMEDWWGDYPSLRLTW